MSPVHPARKIIRREGSGGRHWLSASLALGILLFAAACATAARGTQPSAASISASPSPSLTTDPSIGPADAPVTIIEYGDFG